MKRDTFSLRKTFLKPISNLSDAQLGSLFRAIYRYQCGEAPEPADDVAVYFSFFESEFEEEEARRRRRAEKAAERRRKKLEDAKAAVESEEAAAAGQVSGDQAVNSRASDSQCSIGSEPVNDLSYFDSKLIELPGNDLYFRESQEKRHEEFLIMLKYNYKEIYAAGGKDMTLTEFYTISSVIGGKQTLWGYCDKLGKIKDWNKNGHTFYQCIMKIYADETGKV